jgi:hypothetical protein
MTTEASSKEQTIDKRRKRRIKSQESRVKSRKKKDKRQRTKDVRRDGLGTWWPIVVIRQ